MGGFDHKVSRRGVLKTGLAGATLATAPFAFVRGAGAAKYRNMPTGSTVTFGFNVPQTGAYADEGADELRAYKLAVQHINGEGDGGMLNTFSSKALKGNGVNGKKVVFVTGDTQTKSDAARASAKRMIEKDGAIMITGGSSSGVAIAVQGLCQEAGVIFMAGLTHSNDTTGKDKKANGFRHFFNTEMTGAALAPVLKNNFRHGPHGLSPDRRLYLGLVAGRLHQEVYRKAWVENGCQSRTHTSWCWRLLAVHHAGSQFRCRCAGP